jgi:hypothetical protein
VGHTDTDGDEGFNLGLSLDRAEAVKAYLKDDVAAWEAWFGDGKSKEKRWGSGEVVHMSSALPCEKSIRGFQAWSNDTNGTSLDVDGDAGPSTRKELIKAYMALDGTTLPEAIEAVVHGPSVPITGETPADWNSVSEPRGAEASQLCRRPAHIPSPPGARQGAMSRSGRGSILGSIVTSHTSGLFSDSIAERISGPFQTSSQASPACGMPSKRARMRPSGSISHVSGKSVVPYFAFTVLLSGS